MGALIWGLRVLVINCHHFANIPFTKGPKRPQMCTIADDCARLAESGLRPLFESPHLNFPMQVGNSGGNATLKLYFVLCFAGVRVEGSLQCHVVP